MSHFARRIHDEQPESAPGRLEPLEPRPLEGFVFAVTPFNFTAIAGNLPTAPALMGNTVVWKPAPNAVSSAHFIMRALDEAGLPPGVINLVHGPPPRSPKPCSRHPALAGCISLARPTCLRRLCGSGRRSHRELPTFPRLVGETGGKDFVFAHPSADVDALAVGAGARSLRVPGAKCSAASRVYVPASIFPALQRAAARAHRRHPRGRRGRLSQLHGRGHRPSARTTRSRGYLELARTDATCTVLAGGAAPTSNGFFIHPTFVETNDPTHRLMREEIFGPVLTAVGLSRRRLRARARALRQLRRPMRSPAPSSRAIGPPSSTPARALRHAAGNFYINDKPTGAVVGQQPFGGARASGTNDKAGSVLNLLPLGFAPGRSRRPSSPQPSYSIRSWMRRVAAGRSMHLDRMRQPIGFDWGRSRAERRSRRWSCRGRASSGAGASRRQDRFDVFLRERVATEP